MKQDSSYSVLREWCLTIYDFYMLTYPDTTTRFIVNLYKQSVKKIDKRRDLKQMKALYAETNKMFREDLLGSEAMKKLNQILKDKFNKDISEEIEKEVDVTREIVRRGHIIDDNEYRLIKQYEDDIHEDDCQADYAETLRQLMSEYEGGTK